MNNFVIKEKSLNSSPARMRFVEQAIEELKRLDPDTPVSARMVRSLVKSGKIPSVPVGNGTRRLINLDALLEYLENPPAEQPEQARGIRRVDERGRG